MAYPNWVFTLSAFIGFILCCIPFAWHFQAWNTGTCLLMAWLGLYNLILAINSIIWYNNAINVAPVWCDISSRFIVGAAVAIPACGLCITRRLYRIASVRTVTITRAEKRRQIMIDLAIGLGIPILEMILQYIPQGHRFNIFQEIGCQPTTYLTWVGYLIVYVPPVLLGFISAIYGVLSILAFNKSRLQSKEMLSAYSNLTTSRYLRLMAIAGTDILCSMPINIYVIFVNASSGPPAPWISWENTHAGFSRVDQFPSMIWRTNKKLTTSVELERWSVVACSIVFFLFFGFADEARKCYRSAISSVTKRIGISTGTFGGSSGTFTSSEMQKGGIGSHPGSIPGFVVGKRGRKNSFDGSFSDASSDLKDINGAPASPTSSIDEKKNSSLTNIFSGKKRLNEEVFKPSFHYDDLVLPDVGGTLADECADDISSVPTSGSSSSASSISMPEPIATHVAEETRRNSHEMV